MKDRRPKERRTATLWCIVSLTRKRVTNELNSMKERREREKEKTSLSLKRSD